MTTTKLHLWTVEEYHRMIDTGILAADDKVELLDGRIIQMSPQRPPHAATTQRACDYLKARLAGQAYVRMQLPITLPTSEPEPDIAVVRIDSSEYGTRHPIADEIFLLIEVSYSTLDIDINEKAPIYARANILEYWILDVINRQAYIFRNPNANGYESEIILTPNDLIAPLAFPEFQIPLTQLFLL